MNEDHALAIKVIVTFTPILCSILAFVLTYIGRRLYADRMARLTIAATVKNLKEKVEDVMN